jgi:hypothetical protein
MQPTVWNICIGDFAFVSDFVLGILLRLHRVRESVDHGRFCTLLAGKP